MIESATNRRRATTRLSRTALSGVVALAVVGLAACNATASASVTPATCGRSSRLTVQGSGLATGTPNLLTLTTSVNAIDATAQSALAADNRDTAAVIAALTRGGVKDRDIQTTGLSIQPNYTTNDG
ncbi:MAG TPA: SIMPL domain-containing protein, partial [Acidimicrobiales bacterium]|nr:SIMPL domain-containing protein [Acidimicrobiales bacterium]